MPWAPRGCRKASCQFGLVRLTPTGSMPSARIPASVAWMSVTMKLKWCGPAPRELPEPGPPASFDLIEHYVGDLAAATRLFGDVLDGRLEAATDAAAELTWPGGKRIRLVHADGLPLGGALHHVRFTRAAGAFSARDAERARLLAKRLGLTVELT